jgi:FkbM family methyltransferase
MQPYLLGIARKMVRREIRGGHRLTHELGRLGLLKRPAHYRVGDAIFTVPLHLMAWDRQDVLDYCPNTIRETARVASAMKSALLVDCGAQIGIFSTLLVADCPNISEIIAIEPNRIWWEWERVNLDALSGIRTRLIKGAVAEFHGTGTLRAADHDPSLAALSFAPHPDGEIEAHRLDDLVPDYSGDVILKLDVEGGEMAALRGGVEMLERPKNLVVVIEAHPQVAADSGIDPVEYIRFMRSIRPFDEVVVSDVPAQRVRTEIPFFTQFHPQVYNIVCASYAREYR